jgi:hypothetical protein
MLAPTGRRKKTHEIQKASQALRMTGLAGAQNVTGKPLDSIYPTG